MFTRGMYGLRYTDPSALLTLYQHLYLLLRPLCERGRLFCSSVCVHQYCVIVSEGSGIEYASFERYRLLNPVWIWTNADLVTCVAECNAIPTI